MGINNSSLEPVDNIIWLYTITFTNYTNETLYSVVVTYSVQGQPEPLQIQLRDWPPQHTDVFKLCPCAQLVDYTIFIHFTDGTYTSMPDENDPRGPMTPRRRREEYPLDHFLCEDSWALYPN